MRKALSVVALLALGLTAAAPATSQQTSKYTLVIVASGFNDGAKRDGVSMLSMGVYPGRQECEAAGGGVKVGAVSGGKDGEPAAAITWVCVPLGKP